MKTIKNWQIKKLTYDDTRSNGFCHCPSVLVYKGKESVIGAGESDILYLFEHNGEIVLLAINSRHGYAGITVYDNALNEVGDSFLQCDYDFMALLERNDPEYAVDKFFSYSPNYQAKLLLSLVN